MPTEKDILEMLVLAATQTLEALELMKSPSGQYLEYDYIPSQHLWSIENKLRQVRAAANEELDYL